MPVARRRPRISRRIIGSRRRRRRNFPRRSASANEFPLFSPAVKRAGYNLGEIHTAPLRVLTGEHEQRERREGTEGWCISETKGGVWWRPTRGERRKERTRLVTEDWDLNSVHASPFRYANGVVPLFLRSHFVRRDSSAISTAVLFA